MKTGFEPVKSCAPPEDTVWEMDFTSLYHSLIHNPKYFRCHWLWLEAMKKPDTWIVYDYWEDTDEKRVYRRWARFNKLTGIMETNWGGCPNRTHHHIGVTCKVCNQHG